MNTAELLADAYGRTKEAVHAAVDGLTPEELAHRVDSRGNSVVWLIWHLSRVQDDQIADALGRKQTWTEDGWVERFGLPFDPADIGYGHTPDQVAQVQVDSRDLLTAYYDAVHERTLTDLRALTDADLDRIVDNGITPAVPLGVRLVSVLEDCMQHVGQAALLHGALLRARG